jgi:hypothetical protein
LEILQGSDVHCLRAGGTVLAEYDDSISLFGWIGIGRSH